MPSTLLPRAWCDSYGSAVTLTPLRQARLSSGMESTPHRWPGRAAAMSHRQPAAAQEPALLSPNRPNGKFPAGNQILPHHQLQPPERHLSNCEGCRYNVPAIGVPGSFATVSSHIFKTPERSKSLFLSVKRVASSAGTGERSSHQVPRRLPAPVSRR